MTQTLLGYTAMDAGLVGLPATITQMIMVQIVGYLSDKFDIRRIILIGLILSVIANLNYLYFSLSVGFSDIAMARVVQTFGLAFLGTTVNTAAYYTVKPENNNNASALLNLARNMGMSMGVAMTSTFLVLRTQVYVSNMSSHISNSNPIFVNAVNELARNFKYLGLNSENAAGAATAYYQNELLRQATMNAILDAFYIYMILFIVVMPCVFLLRSKKQIDKANA
jgi:DHA2 family multidrug resistance protein